MLSLEKAGGNQLKIMAVQQHLLSALSVVTHQPRKLHHEECTIIQEIQTRVK